MSDPEAVYVYANVQLDDPGLLEKLAGHDVQLDAPAALYVPDGQLIGYAAPGQ